MFSKLFPPVIEQTIHALYFHLKSVSVPLFGLVKFELVHQHG